jgi:hypothetical protein
MPPTFVQRNVYKGQDPRCWVRLRFVALDGSLHERELLADTGSPCAVIVGLSDHVALRQAESAEVQTNFGTMQGGWFELAMPEFGLIGRVPGFGSNQVLRAVRSDSHDFSGLVGLPLLRMLDYGGDDSAFWICKQTRSAR